METKLLTTKEVAKMLDTTVRAVQCLTQKGKLKPQNKKRGGRLNATEYRQNVYLVSDVKKLQYERQLKPE